MAGRKPGFVRTAWKAFCYGLGIAVVAVLAVQLWFYGHVLWLRVDQPSSSAFMERRLDELRARNPKARIAHQWVGYERISIQLKRAVVAAEDAKFISHEGFDWEAISKAMERNERKGKIVAGASTISQQLAKNLFLSPARSYWRKGEEAVITVMLENLLSKERIFELYLNVIEWGNGVFGAEAASHRYYGVSAAQLSAEQGARLAAMAPNPRFYERNPGAPGLARKTVIILGRMQAAELP